MSHRENQLDYTESELLLALQAAPGLTQRELAERAGLSLGLTNRTLKALRQEGWLGGEDGQLTAKALSLLEALRPRRAVILAAGYGMRMVPVSNTPKALLEVRGERLVERQIRQLRAAGVGDISVVAGYRKEQFEYLTDEFGVTLLLNPDYALSNNLHSLALAARQLENCYVLPCDLYCEENPFRPYELCSWYAVSEEEDPASDVRLNRKGELVRRDGAADAPVAAFGGAAAAKPNSGSRMVGIAYFCGPEAEALRERLLQLDADPRFRNAFWEEALYDPGSDTGRGRKQAGSRMAVPGRVLPAGDAVEINTYEQLRELDSRSGSLQAGALEAICRVFGAGEKDVTGISVLKKGMTNRSFVFTVRGGQYIMRIPGEGTDKLISRPQEAAVYAAIRGRGLCDDPLYLDPETGYKITRFLPGVRVCDPENPEDLKRCMAKLRAFHALCLQVPHRFDLWGQIDFYESLWPSPQSLYRDYRETKASVLRLKDWVEAQPKETCLTHVDAVCDNFLFTPEEGNADLPQLTDWEYAGMADPHLDLAMFAVYSAFGKEQLDRLIDLYFAESPAGGPADLPAEEGPASCPPETRIKIYCYAAACGLLWSNWCEYKSSLGVEFGEYSLWQYRAAKTYGRLALRELRLSNP